MGNVLGNQGQGMGDALYGYAKIKASIGLVVGIIIGCALLYGGYYLSETDTKKSNTQGIIKKSSCSRTKDNNYSCNIEYEFTVNDKIYNSIHYGYISSYILTVSQGSNITVYYNEKDPTDSSLSTSKNIKYVLYGFGALVLLGCIAQFILVFYSKAYGTISGATDAVSSVAGAFRSTGSPILGSSTSSGVESNLASSLSNTFNETFKFK